MPLDERETLFLMTFLYAVEIHIMECLPNGKMREECLHGILNAYHDYGIRAIHNKLEERLLGASGLVIPSWDRREH